MWKAFRSGHWPTLLGAWLHFEVSFMAWLLIGALSVPIASEFGLTATEKGLLVALPLLGGAFLRVVVGFGSDWYGPKVMGLSVLTCELAAVVWGWLGAASYGQVLAVGLLLGVAGTSFAVALPIASRAYPPAHQGLAMGVAASANSGTVLSMFFCATACAACRLAWGIRADDRAPVPNRPAVPAVGPGEPAGLPIRTSTQMVVDVYRHVEATVHVLVVRALRRNVRRVRRVL